MSLIRRLSKPVWSEAQSNQRATSRLPAHRRLRTLRIEGLESRHALSAVPLTAEVPTPATTDVVAAAIARPTLDLNGDGIVDAVWRNANTGLNVGWIYDNTGAVTSTRIVGGDLNWAIEDVGYFNSDAVSDLVWRNAAGSTVIWLMGADGSVLSAGFIGGDAAWRLEASGDYNGDLLDDVVWRDSTGGGNVMWLMNGTSPTSQTAIGGNLTWRLASTSADYDSNNDGRTDLIWTNTAGAKVLHRMNGPAILSASVLSVDPLADLVGTGDFDNDGNQDLLWRNRPATVVPGIVVGWKMNDGTVLSTTVLGGNLDWAVNNTVDANGDGTRDIIWRQASTGGTVVWIMGGFTPVANSVLGGDSIWALIRRPGVHPA